AEDGIRDFHVTGVQTCALPIFAGERSQCAEATYSLHEHPGWSCPICQFAAANAATIRVAALDSHCSFSCARSIEAIAEQTTFQEIGRASCRERGESWGGEG